MSTSPTLNIRPATRDDTPILRRWDEQPHVRAATSNDGSAGSDMDWDEELLPRDDGTEFFMALVDQRPIGMLQIIDPATERTHYWGEIESGLRAIDIWIGETAFLGHGHGTRMMRFAIAHCFRPPDVKAILIDPLANNVRAHAFYRKMGFVFVERRVFDETSNCLVFRLDREGVRPESSLEPERR